MHISNVPFSTQVWPVLEAAGEHEGQPAAGPLPGPPHTDPLLYDQV